MADNSWIKDQASSTRACIDQLFKDDKINHKTYLKLRETVDTFEGVILRCTTEGCYEYAVEDFKSGETVLYTDGIKYTWKDESKKG